MTEQMAHIVYLIAGVLFIFSLAGLAKQETARSGNLCGIIGMAIAILVAMAMASGLHSLVYAAIALGAVLGAIVTVAPLAGVNCWRSINRTSTPKFVRASAAVLAPVPPSATARSVMPVILPPVTTAFGIDTAPVERAIVTAAPRLTPKSS